MARDGRGREGKGKMIGGELGLIRHIQREALRRAPQGRQGELRLGIGDDCAILRPRRGEEIVVTTDFSLEGRHFRRDWHPPESVGHRTLARGLSDVAAMGARPIAAFLSLALPRSVVKEAAWVSGFLEGFLALAQRSGVPLAGGDTAEAPGEQVLADVALLGAVPQGRALRRDGAVAGDRLFVTGALGGAATELERLTHSGRVQLSDGVAFAKMGHPHLFPEPRLKAGQTLLRRAWAAAAIDVSDGLSTDLHHLCEASGVGAEIEAARLPLHPSLGDKGEAEALRTALHGGEDYELLFAARAEVRLPGRVGGVRVTEIGRVVARARGRPRVVLLDADGRRLALQPEGWEHLT